MFLKMSENFFFLFFFWGGGEGWGHRPLWPQTNKRHGPDKFLDSWDFWGCRDGAVVRALASHQCGPGSIARSKLGPYPNFCPTCALVVNYYPSNRLKLGGQAVPFFSTGPDPVFLSHKRAFCISLATRTKAQATTQAGAVTCFWFITKRCLSLPSFFELELCCQRNARFRWLLCCPVHESCDGVSWVA